MDSNHRFSLQRERAIHYTKSINKNLLTEKRVSDSNGCLIPWDGSILTTKLTRLYIIIVNIFFVAPAWLEHAQPQGSKVFKTFLYTSSNMEPFYLFIYLFIYLIVRVRGFEPPWALPRWFLKPVRLANSATPVLKILFTMLFYKFIYCFSNYI